MFPQRQRCKACRRGLGQEWETPVYAGLFCSPRCGGLPVPPTDPAKAPRECTTERDGAKVFKRRYRSVGEIPDKIASDPTVSHYLCGSCSHWHIGHSRLSGPEPVRGVRTAQELAETLVKLRGRATHAQVAKAAKVPAIRLKELENPKKGQRVDLDVLMAVLPLLGASLAVQVKERR